MRLKRLKHLFLTHFRVTTRNKLSFFFSLIFPLMFIGIMGLAFQEGDPGNSTIPLGIINHDQGVPENATVYDRYGNRVEGTYFSQDYINILDSITFEDNETEVFDITLYQNTEVVAEDLDRRTIKGLLVIPTDFTLAFMAKLREKYEIPNTDGFPPENYSSSIDLQGDPSLIQFNIASSIITEITEQYFTLGDATEEMEVRISHQDTSGYSVFDRTVPGLVIFAIISNTSTVATVALGDVESKMIDRLRLSKMKPWEYTSTLIFSQLCVAFLQIPIMFGAAFVFGFPISPQIVYAFIFAIFVSLGMTGIGVLLAGLVSNADAVGGLSAIVTTPMAFLAGAFFPVPNPVIIPTGSILGDHEFAIFDLLPPTKAIDALRLVLINGYTISEVWFELTMVAILSVWYLGLGILVYSKKHLQIR